MSELHSITELCLKLGAAPGQAATMARQLVKRADQIAAARGIPREAAMTELLQILVLGSQGRVPAAFNPPGPPSE